MSSDKKSVEIVVCLGTSCFVRGNSKNLAILKRYAQSHDAEISVRLTGKLCQDQCGSGPNLMVGGELHHDVTPERLCALLQQLGGPFRGDHGIT